MNNKIIILDISFQFGGVDDKIHHVVLLDDKDIVLIDCGYMGFLPNIETALLDNGIEPSALTKVLITHHDHDHVGSLFDLKKKYPHVQIVASAGEANYINGTLKSLRLEQAEMLQSILPETQKEFGKQFIDMLRLVKPVPVDITINSGDIMPWCDGCEIISTPGHTPGHISLYLSKMKTLIAGDAIVLEGGIPTLANPQFALDKEAADCSFDKLLKLAANRIICYHGGIYDC
ncbi:MAG: MBL fold metallo-hydrolase [Clostridiales bacterium]|nr:MBL fold metallo-hydrolase [Clostridiales bacterium]